MNLILHYVCRMLPLIAAISLSGCNTRSATETLVMPGHAMGTTWQVTLPNYPNSADAANLKDEVAATLEQLESQMSHWREDSIISRFNRHHATVPIPITPEIAAVIQEAQRVYQQTGGVFDITAAPLVNLWGFGPQGQRENTPTAEQIEAALGQVGGDQLHLGQTTPGRFTLSKQHPNVEIDLSALAKGYAIDIVAELLEARQLNNYLIEFGGELRARGTNADGEPWQVGLEQPDSNSIGRIRRTVALRDQAIATSGGYRNFIRDSSTATTRPHIIDPRTGRPVSHNLVAVSVIESTAMRADAWATALFVLGPEQGYNLARERNIAATFVVSSPRGMIERSTPGSINRWD